MSKGLMQIISGYTMNNIDSDLSLGSVANHFGISEAHLSRAFKKEFNIGFLQFITDKKMEMAAKMLVDTENDFNVKDIEIS